MGDRAGLVSLNASAAAVLILTACGEPIHGPNPSPVLEALEATARPENALSILVTGHVEFADSVAVRYGLSGMDLDSLTPAVSPSDEQLSLPVLGLLPDTAYELLVLAYGDGSIVSRELFHVTTGSLPEDLPLFHAGGTSPLPGFVIFSTGLYGVAIDNTGRVVWYVRLEGHSLNFQAQPNGHYIARPNTPDPDDVEPLVELDPLGGVTRRLYCARDLRPRFHDVLVEPDGSYWVMCDETRVMDLSGFGGAAEASVTGTVIQHITNADRLTFDWSPFDHFQIDDLEPELRSGAMVNWTHGNALDLDRDGNLVVSFRSLSEIAKIDTKSGTVVWRMGGLRNQFTFADPGAPFLRQHGVRVANGELVLLDNYGEAAGSRAERYAVNEDDHTARLIGAYAPGFAIRAALGGSTQRLSEGHTLVAFGDGGRVQEYDGNGEVVWEIEGNAGYVFRAQHIYSLYHPEIGLVR